MDNFAQSYLLQSQLKIVELFLENFLNIKPNTLLLSGIAAALYAVLTAIEAVGLWYEKGWATLLVLVLVGLSIPPEIYELFEGGTLLKLAVFIANLAVLGYLLHHLPKHGKGA